MKNSLLSLKFNILIVKPYIKSFLFVLIYIAIFGIFNKSPQMMGIFPLVMSSIFLIYPFSIEEKNNLEMLYGILPISRKNMVIGRYLFEIFIGIATTALTIPSMLIIANIFNIDLIFSETVIIILAGFLLYSFIGSTQLPIYFKLGYTKARFLAYLPIIIIVMLFTLIPITLNYINPQILYNLGEYLNNSVTNINIYLIASLLLAVSLIIILISCIISIRIYNKHEFNK